MSLTIAIQACCQVFQVSYEELIQVDHDREGKVLTWFSIERKFTAYYLLQKWSAREVASVMSVSIKILRAYEICISELINEEFQHLDIIYRIDARYLEMSKRIKTAS